jgi:hypothetical protein
MNASQTDRPSDRWGHEDEPTQPAERESDSFWWLGILALLLILALVGGGFMTFRARQMQMIAAVERAQADAVRQAELARQAAEKAAKDAEAKKAE